MNDTVQTSPAVAAFVAQVRARLGDLTEEEREELLGGLEADLAERLAEGEAALGDPAAYAAELRAAAGLEARPRGWAVRRPAGTRRPMADHLSELLDADRPNSTGGPDERHRADQPGRGSLRRPGQGAARRPDR